MSDRYLPTDRYYDRHSDDILSNLSEDSVKNDKELHSLKWYKHLLLEYRRISWNIYPELNKNTDFKRFLIEQLTKLENSKPIQDILHRERKPNENIYMTFGNDNVFKLYSVLYRIKKSIRKD